MAKHAQQGGYSCNFIDPTSDDDQCPLCHLVLRKPHITSCCSNHFCYSCISGALADGESCPRCRNENFTTLLDRELANKINSLRVYCICKAEGCEWMGSLDDLESHLCRGETEGECRYLAVECLNHCGKKIARKNLQAHIQYDCPERTVYCRYCGHKCTSISITTKHFEVCEKYPVECPNECELPSIERSQLEAHRKTCPLEDVQCIYNFAGCKERLKRKDVPTHMEENTQCHLDLLTQAVESLTRANTQLEQRVASLEQHRQASPYSRND